MILGASALKGARLLSEGVPRQARGGLLLGAVSAFASTLASLRVLRERRPGPLLPYSLYRCLLAGLVSMRVRRERGGRA